jgi:uncharacterized protein YbjT (DUF2867 family)
VSRVVVIGATEHLGSYLVRARYEVVALSRGLRESLRHLISTDQLDLPLFLEGPAGRQ